MAKETSEIRLISPYAEGQRWLRGNLHTHTTFSDGKRTPEAVIKDYENRGYDFLAISDHDVFVKPDKYQRMTQMTLIPGVEVSANGPHILHVNAQTLVPPHENRQQVLDEISAQPESFAVLNHPNWLAPLPDLHFSHERMRSLTGYAGIEIYNGVIERLPGIPLATDQWDLLLSKGHRVWGFGHDDSHDVQDVELAWNVVQSHDRRGGPIVAALREGRFYVSTGVEIQSVRIKDRHIVILTNNAMRIRFISRWGVIRHTMDSQAAEFIIPDDPNVRDWMYIRMECYGPRGSMAWTQPIWIEAG
ncbi:MAG: PHP domain-containing protein [candidate division Zixibacteria bacterium]|nr:PHP domain-containing protein [candidate division Zixibacteria bacterium]